MAEGAEEALQDEIKDKPQAKACDPCGDAFTSLLNPTQAANKTRLDLAASERLATLNKTKRGAPSLVWSIAPKEFSSYNDIKFKQLMVCNTCLDVGNEHIAEFNAGGGSTTSPKNHLQSHHKPLYDQLPKWPKRKTFSKPNRVMYQR